MKKNVLKILLISLMIWIPLSAQTSLEHHINHIAVEVPDDGALLFRSSGVLQATWPYESRYYTSSGRKNYQESWGIWLGVKDFTGENDTVSGYGHIACGNFYKNTNDITALSLQKSIRYEYPTIRISDGENVQGESFSSAKVVSSLYCDEQISSTWTTSLGLTVQLKTYAYAAKGNQDYIIYDYTFTNTGNTDGDAARELTNILEDVWLGFSFSTDIKPGFGGKDQDDYFKYYGSTYEDYVNGDESADSARILYVWDGPDGYGTYEPDLVTYEPQNPGYYAIGFLHVDAQAADDLESGSSDGPSQPKTVQVASALESSASAQYQKMAEGIISDTSGYGAENYIVSCGPYRMPINEDVRIVLVQIIAGIDRFKAEDLGYQLLNGEITQQEYEDIIATAKDSVFTTFDAAKTAFESRYNIADAPPPPDSLYITSGIGKITLEWSDSPESIKDPDTDVIDFAGYRIYRVAISPEYAWERVFECGGNSGIPITHSYVDTNLVMGFSYYYAVTAFDDGTQNFMNPGVSLESSRMTSSAYLDATSSLEPETTHKGIKTNLRVVPNPYNIRSQNFGDPNNASNVENNKILFVGLPGICDIRIYTVAGDLVKVIEHNNGLGSEPWYLISDSQQYIVSGLYIAVVESDLGKEIIKFVVIR